MRRAVIDVGTNSVKVLVAEVDPDTGFVVAIHEQGIQTRLGAGFYQSQLLQPGPIQETSRVCAEFVETARKLGAFPVRIIATSAARDARNAEELVQAILKSTGLPLEVLDGGEEARLAFEGVVSDSRLAGHPVAILDVGGGSTELILGTKGQIQFQKSCQLGTVRLLEQFPPGDPPAIAIKEECESWVCSFLIRELGHAISAANLSIPGEAVWIGTGGTAVLLGRILQQTESYDRDLIESKSITASELRKLQDGLWSMPAEARRHVPGLPPNRADVILYGTLILGSILATFGGAEMRVSTRGLRFGAIAQKHV